MAEIIDVSGCAELSLGKCTPCQYHKDLYRHMLLWAHPCDQSGQKFQFHICHIDQWTESIVGENMRLSTEIYNVCAQKHRKQNPLSISAQIIEIKKDWWREGEQILFS